MPAALGGRLDTRIQEGVVGFDVEPEDLEGRLGALRAASVALPTTGCSHSNVGQRPEGESRVASPARAARACERGKEIE